jgi:putative hydrolase of the HAD superfamily
VPREEEVSSNVILARVLAEWDAPPSATVLSAATESFFGFFQQRMRAYSDTLCALRALGARSLPLGLLTDVPYGMPATFVRRDLRAAGIAEFFSAVLTSGDVGRRKPAAAGFVALAEQLGVAPEGLLFIGNEAKDVIGARRAGARAVFLDHTDSGVDHGQEFTICRLSDALPLLDLPSA